MYVGASIARPRREEFDKIIEKRDSYSAGRAMLAPTVLLFHELLQNCHN
ncbi:MAG: hypothetical protein FWF46_09020 [Oscillospiraceae bacterium]|nr:hypothetical protein [Oscillospiraceae bacterium]